MFSFSCRWGECIFWYWILSDLIDQWTELVWQFLCLTAVLSQIAPIPMMQTVVKGGQVKSAEPLVLVRASKPWKQNMGHGAGLFPLFLWVLGTQRYWVKEVDKEECWLWNIIPGISLIMHFCGCTTKMEFKRKWTQASVWQIASVPLLYFPSLTPNFVVILQRTLMPVNIFPVSSSVPITPELSQKDERAMTRYAWKIPTHAYLHL